MFWLGKYEKGCSFFSIGNEVRNTISDLIKKGIKGEYANNSEENVALFIINEVIGFLMNLVHRIKLW